MNITIIKCDLCGQVISDDTKMHVGRPHHRSVTLSEHVTDGPTPRCSAADMCDICFETLCDTWNNLKKA